MLVWHGSGELFIYDHWIPVTSGDVGYAPVGCPIAWRCPTNNHEDMVVLVVTSPCPFSEYVKTGLMVKDESDEGTARDWSYVWKWSQPANAGLLGHPGYYVYPGQR